MKFLWLSEAGDGMGLALRVLEEGNDVAMIIKHGDNLRIGDGLVPKVTDWKFVPDHDTVIVGDCTGWGAVGDALRLGGYPVLDASQIADRLEMDRKFSLQVMQKAGIQVPASYQFKDWDQAFDFVKKHQEQRLVFKPGAELSGNLPSYPADDAEDLWNYMDWCQRKYFGPPEFELQEFIEGVVISSECYFNGSEFVRPFNHTLETKKAHAGDTGPSGGCSGNIVWACDDQIADAAILPLEGFLRAEQYCGPIDVNAVANEEGIWGLEFTPRFGYDASPTLFWSLLKTEVGKFLSDCARGQTTQMDLGAGYAAGIKLSLPPWPSEEYSGPEGIPINVWPSKESTQLYPYQLMEVDGRLVTAGCQGIVGVALGSGDSVKAAFADAYKIARRLKVPDLQYRDDLRQKFEDQLEKLEVITTA